MTLEKDINLEKFWCQVADIYSHIHTERENSSLTQTHTHNTIGKYIFYNFKVKKTPFVLNCNDEQLMCFENKYLYYIFLLYYMVDDGG